MIVLSDDLSGAAESDDCSKEYGNCSLTGEQRVAAVLLLYPGLPGAADIDWFKIKTLKDRAFLEYVETLDLKGEAALRFWKKIPLSRANPQVYKLPAWNHSPW